MAEPKRQWTYIPPAWTGTQVEGTGMLPFGRYQMPDGTEQVSFGLPQPLLDAVRAVGYAGGREQDPAAPQGYVSANALQRGAEGLAGSAAVGSLGVRAPAGLRSGLARNAGDLDPSPAARMARAREMGFGEDVFYHGSTKNFDEFVPSETGEIGPGVYITHRPDQASEYARGYEGGRSWPDEANVRAVRVRGKLKPMDRKAWLDRRAEEFKRLQSENNGNWDSSFYERAQQNIADEIQNEGYAGFYLKNPGGPSLMYDQGVVFDPRNIRSTQAMFDPSKSDSANLLAANRSQSAAPGQILAQKNALDPSPAARLARAREMGWDTDTPHYRGMTRVYDPDKAPDWQFFSTNPEEASGYAPGLVGDKIKPNVMASYLRPGRQLVVEGGGANFNEIPVSGLPADVREIIARTTAREGVRTDDIAKAAKELGYDTVSFQNIYDRSWGEKPPKNTGMDWDEIQNLLTELTGEAPAPKPKNWEATQVRRNEPGTVTAVINPANIRARTAMFDPARINESDPLAANPLAGAVPLTWRQDAGMTPYTMSDIQPGERILTPEEVAELEISRNPQRAKRNRLLERARR